MSSSDISGVVSMSSISSDDAIERVFDLEVNNRLYEVTLMDNNGDMSFVIGSERRDIACVVITFNRDGAHSWDSDALLLSWFSYDSKCARDTATMERERTKPMLIGALKAFAELRDREFPHVKTLRLSDVGTFKCDGSNAKIPMIVSSLILKGRTYYQSLLAVKPDSPQTSHNLETCLAKLTESVTTFDKFWKAMEKNTWVKERRSSFERSFQDVLSAGQTWRDFLAKLYGEHGCALFENTHKSLARFFEIDKLIHTDWIVDMDDIPAKVDGRPVTYTLSEQAMRGGGSKKAKNILKASKYLRNKTKSEVRKARLDRVMRKYAKSKKAA
jgi:hypothetical protein